MVDDPAPNAFPGNPDLGFQPDAGHLGDNTRDTQRYLGQSLPGPSVGNAFENQIPMPYFPQINMHMAEAGYEVGPGNIFGTLEPVPSIPGGNGAIDLTASSPGNPAVPFETGESWRSEAIMGRLDTSEPSPGSMIHPLPNEQPRRSSRVSKPNRRFPSSDYGAMLNSRRILPTSYPEPNRNVSVDPILLNQSPSPSGSMAPPPVPRMGSERLHTSPLAPRSEIAGPSRKRRVGDSHEPNEALTTKRHRQ